MKTTIIACGAVLFVLVFPARLLAADMFEVGPQVPAAKLIAAHGASEVPILRITYAQSEDGKPAHLRRADIAADFILSDEDEGRLLVDYKLRRRIQIDVARHGFMNLSLFMMPDFRYLESYNRRMERGIVKKLGMPNPPPDLTNSFWTEQELGIVPAADEPASVAPSALPGGGMKYVADGIVAARFTPSAHALSAQEMKGFARYLRETAYLHPMVVQAIVDSGRVPQTLSFVRIQAGTKASFAWTLQSVERVTGSYPLPPDASPELLSADAPQGDGDVLHDLIPLMLDAVAGRARGGPRSIADYQAALADALKSGRIAQHFVLYNEFTLQYGLHCGASCKLAPDVLAKWKADPRVHAWIESFSVESDGHDPKRAIDMRERTDRGGISNAYMIDDWIGDAYTESGKPEKAIPLIANAIRGNPYIGGFYKDLGDAYNHEFDPVDSWLCYDLARALPGGSSAPVVDTLTKREDYLLAAFPEYF